MIEKCADYIAFYLVKNGLIEQDKMKRKDIKKIWGNFLANIALKSAIHAAGTASAFGYHQPKEPKIELRKKS